MPYRHTQHSILIVSLCLLAAALNAFVIWLTGHWMPSAAVLAVMIAVAIVFSSLTVEVNDSELQWSFGPGFWTSRLPRGEIEKVAIVRNHWWYGFGIRRGSGYRLYNVEGLDAVEVRMKSSEVRRIGTDDPQGLAAALQTLPRRI